MRGGSHGHPPAYLQRFARFLLDLAASCTAFVWQWPQLRRFGAETLRAQEEAECQVKFAAMARYEIENRDEFE